MCAKRCNYYTLPPYYARVLTCVRVRERRIYRKVNSSTAPEGSRRLRYRKTEVSVEYRPVNAFNNHLQQLKDSICAAHYTHPLCIHHRHSVARDAKASLI